MIKRRFAQWAVLVLSGLSIAFGVYRGEVETVLNKAIHICMECIGLG